MRNRSTDSLQVPNATSNGAATGGKTGAINYGAADDDGRPRDDTAWTESAIDHHLGPPDRQLLKGATTNLQTMMHIFKGNIGPGILAMPYAFSKVGLIPGMIVWRTRTR